MIGRVQVKKSLPCNVNIMEEDLEKFLKEYEINIHKIEFGHIQTKSSQRIYNQEGWQLRGYETWTKISPSKNYTPCHWEYHSHFRFMLENCNRHSTPYFESTDINKKILINFIQEHPDKWVVDTKTTFPRHGGLAKYRFELKKKLEERKLIFVRELLEN